MRKLMSKKGFTLVELMIVVVILGILVAVAVPIFSAVTKNARIKSCKSNQRVIKGNLETIVTTGNDGDAITIDSTGINFASDTTYGTAFLNLFDGGHLPDCPSAKGDVKTNHTSYKAEAKANAAGAITYDASCQVTELPSGEVHN